MPKITTQPKITAQSITRFNFITKVQEDNNFTLDRNDEQGWRKVWEEGEGKKWKGDTPANNKNTNKYYQWWFKSGDQNHINPWLQKKYGPNKDLSVKDMADMLLLLADASNKRWGFRAAIVPDTIVGCGTKESDVDPNWLELFSFIKNKKKGQRLGNQSSQLVLDYLVEHGKLCINNEDCYPKIDPNGPTKGRCKASVQAKNIYLELAGVNHVGTKREEFPTDPATLEADFNTWMDEDHRRRQLLRAVQDGAAKQVELYKAWVENLTPWERDEFWLETCDPRFRAYCEEMIHRFWKLKERCGCGKCDGACASEMEWDHDEEKFHEFMGQWVNGVEQKRLDEQNLGHGDPGRYTREELIERRSISTIRCPDSHRFKEEIKIADPTLASKHYKPCTRKKYQALFLLQTAILGRKCLATDRGITIQDFAVLEGHHVFGKRNLLVGDEEYETAKLFERKKLYQTGGSYKDWKERTFPEIPKLCHLHKKVHRTLEYLLKRLDLVLPMLRKKGVEIDWPYEIKGDEVLLQERWRLIEIQSEADMRAKDAIMCLGCGNTAFGTYQSNHINGWYGCLECIKRFMGGLPTKIAEYPTGCHITRSHFDLTVDKCSSSVDQGRALLKSLPATLLEPPSVNRQVDVLYDDTWYPGITTNVRSSGAGYTISVKFDDGSTLRDASYPDQEGGIRLVEIEAATTSQAHPVILLEPPSVDRQVDVLYDDTWYRGTITKVESSGAGYTISVKFLDGSTLSGASYPDDEGGIRLVEIDEADKVSDEEEASTPKVELDFATANNSQGSHVRAESRQAEIKLGDTIFARPSGPVMDWYIPCVVEDERFVNSFDKPVTDFKCRFESSLQLENLQMTKQWVPSSRIISYDCMISSVVQALEQSHLDMQMGIVLLDVARKLKIDPAFVIAINEQFGGIIKSSLQLSSQVEIDQGYQAEIDKGPSDENESYIPFAVPWPWPDEEESVDTNEMAIEGNDNDSVPPQPENIGVLDGNQAEPQVEFESSDEEANESELESDDELIELSQGKRVRIEEIDGEIDRLDGEQGAQAGEEIGYLTKERSDILLLNRSKRIRRTNSDG